MKTLKFRARFRSISNGGECWQFSMINEKTTNSSFIRISEWEQFTGFPDKNGKEIYIGDILAGHKCHFPVEFVNGAFMWGGDFLGYDLEGDYDCMVHITKADCSTLEIIGNVYENPELLNK